MTPAVAERIDLGLVPLWEERCVEPRPVVGPGDQPQAGAVATLESAVDAAWSMLAAGFVAECLLCGGAVQPRWSAGSGVVGGRCDDCGTELE